ncbi:hypothetical protein KAF25_005852 [Fusarium avenaceum]|uniref:Uncharacterized protein n=1 Tax=Fusarium avenaceum TaxID=40199 RepID=A0A9P7GWX3_9HYPO|nr:hypothetical protein KAF25_005852 [Fusarium avenaceum]
MHKYNLTNADGELGVLATRLVGWEGCGDWDSPKREAIYSGWQQSWKVMDAVQGKNINFNEMAALEYLAPSFENEHEQGAIKKIFDTVATVRGGSNLNPFKWSLHVRCDDPAKRCACVPNTMSAYSTNRDSKSGYARINFCPRYFEQPDLDKVVRDNSNKSLPIKHRANLNNYERNKGRVWFHELLHIDWASGVDTANHITDLFAMFSTASGEVLKLKIHGPALTKGLGNSKLDPARWIKKNADSLTMFAMAKTVQKAIGKYPHLPFATTLERVDEIPALAPGLLSTDGVIIDRQEKMTVFSPTDQRECQESDDEDRRGDLSDVVPFNSSAWFMDDSQYPDDYKRQMRGWLADAYPRQNRVRIVLMQTAAGPQWMVFQDTPDDAIVDFCSAKILAMAVVEGDQDNLKFPTELPAFDAHGAKECVYSGSFDVVRGLTCKDGPSDIRCWQDFDWGTMSICDGGQYMLGIKCDWK